MPRVLLIPAAEERGLALARALVDGGTLVRGVVPPGDEAAASAVREAGAEPYEGDADRIGTLMDALAAVTAVAWLHGTATDPERNDGRLRMLCEKLVDTPVRGLVYEGAGGDRGRAIVEQAAATWAIPVAVIETEPADRGAWLSEVTDALRGLLYGERE